MNEKEKELEAREKALAEREKEVERREKALDPFSLAVKMKKEQWYDKVKERVSLRGINAVIWVVSILLAAVIVLIILEAAGIYKLKL